MKIDIRKGLGISNNTGEKKSPQGTKHNTYKMLGERKDGKRVKKFLLS